MQELKDIIESLLFVAEEPLSLDKLRGIIETADSRTIRATLQALGEEYDRRGGGFRLQEVAGGWQIRSRPEYHEWIKRLLHPSPQRLSKAALETLALIAYRQPIIRADIEHIRGVDCGGVLRQLLERKLVRVLGRKEIAGRPLIYATTKLFLEMFELKDLSDLPTPKEIIEFSGGEGTSVTPAADPAQAAAPGQSEGALAGEPAAAPPAALEEDRKALPEDGSPEKPPAGSAEQAPESPSCEYARGRLPDGAPAPVLPGTPEQGAAKAHRPGVDEPEAH